MSWKENMTRIKVRMRLETKKKTSTRIRHPKVRMQTRNRTAHHKLNMLTDSSSPSNRTCLSFQQINGPPPLPRMNCDRLVTEFANKFVWIVQFVWRFTIHLMLEIRSKIIKQLASIDVPCTSFSSTSRSRNTCLNLRSTSETRSVTEEHLWCFWSVYTISMVVFERV